MINRVILAITLAISTKSFADNRLLVFGGNCEANSTNNQFTPYIERLTTSLTSRGWTTQSLLFNNGEAIPRLPQTQPASRQNLLNELDRLIADPTANENTQLLISINDHGLNANGHLEFCLQDNTMMRSDDPQFQQRLAALRRKQIRVGFSLATCYSGAAINDLSTHGCVLSSGSSYEPVWGGHFENLLANFASIPPDQQHRVDLNGDCRLTLDEAYLFNLINREVFNIPQISGVPQTIEQDYNALLNFPRTIADQASSSQNCSMPHLESFERLIEAMTSSENIARRAELEHLMRNFIESNPNLSPSFNISQNARLPNREEFNLTRNQLNQQAHQYAVLLLRERQLTNELDQIHTTVRVTLRPPRRPYDALILRAMNNRLNQPLSKVLPGVRSNSNLREYLAFDYLLEALNLNNENTPEGQDFHRNQIAIAREIQARLQVNEREILRQFNNSTRRRIESTRRAILNARRERMNTWNRYSDYINFLGRMAVNLKFAQLATDSRSRASNDCNHFTLLTIPASQCHAANSARMPTANPQ